MRKGSKWNAWAVGVIAVWMAGSCGAALPTDGMVMHVDSENVGVWTLNGLVARMDDLSASGNDNDLSAQSVNGGPEIVPDALNGYDTLLINNTTNGLRILGPEAGDMNVTTNGLTIFAVFKVPYVTTAYILRHGNDSGSSETGYCIFTEDTRIHSRAADAAGIRQGTTRDATSEWVVYGMVIDPQTGQLTSMYNGDVMAQWFSDGALDAITSAEEFGVGNNVNAAGMELAEIVVYNRALGDSEWNDVGKQLGEKYNIQTAYGGGHIDQLVMHVDSEHVGVWSLNGKVARMDDLSPDGNDNDLRAQSTNGGPEIQENALNGYDTLLLGGTDLALRIDEPTYDTSDLNVTTNGLTVFGVFKAPYTSAWVMGHGNDTSSSEVGWSVFTDETRIHSRAADDSGTRQGTTRTGVSEWVVYATVIDPAAGTLTSIYNGETMAQWFSDGPITDAITSTEDFRVGNSSTSVGMELAELMVFNYALSSDEVGSIGYFLGEKYNIPTTYPEPSGIDGIPYFWIIDNFGTTNGFSGAGNPDLDWMSNLEEYTADTDPNDGDSFLKVLGVMNYSAGTAELVYKNGGIDADVYVEHKGDLGVSWTPIATNVAPVSPTNSYFHVNPDDAGFYRVTSERND